MAKYDITRVGTTKDRLGEGLLWDWRNDVLFWVDSLDNLIHRMDSSGQLTDFPVPREIFALALRVEGNGAVMSLADGFYTFDFDSGRADAVALPQLDLPGLRMNDAKVDPDGNFVAGSLHIRPPEEKDFRGEIFRLKPGFSVETIETNVGGCNGPCFSPDGRTFYYADTPRRAILAYDYRSDRKLTNRRLFADINVFDTRPDGVTVDADGNVWVALVGGGGIAAFSPDGALLHKIDLPVKYPTNVCFGGRDLDVLYVTSLSRSVTLVAEEKEAGGLFKIEGLGRRGKREPLFKG